MVSSRRVVWPAMRRICKQRRLPCFTYCVSMNRCVAAQSALCRNHSGTAFSNVCAVERKTQPVDASHLTPFLAKILAPPLATSTTKLRHDGEAASRAPSTAWFPRHLIPNLEDATLYAQCKLNTTGALRALLSSAMSSVGVDTNATVTPRRRKPQIRTASEAARLLPVLLHEAADEFVQLHKTGSVLMHLPPSDATCDMPVLSHALVIQPTFMRTMLEQALLTILYSIDGPVTRLGGDAVLTFCRHLYRWHFELLSISLRERFVSCLAVMLRASAFSFHIAFELLVRHGCDGVMQRQYCHWLALELFALWWYCNPDQIPIELPMQEQLPLVSRDEDDSIFRELHLGKACKLSNEKPCGGRPNHAAAIAAQSRAVAVRIYGFVHEIDDRRVGEIHHDGGFLSPRMWFSADYYAQLRTKLQYVSGKACLISSALLPRVVHVASALPTQLEARGRALIRQLWGDWVVPVLFSSAEGTGCGEVNDAPDKSFGRVICDEDNCTGTQPQTVAAWRVLFTVAAAAGFVERAMRLLRQRGPSTPTYDALAEDLTCSFVTSWLATVPAGHVGSDGAADDQACHTRRLFRLVLRSFETGGALQPHVGLRPASGAAVWSALHGRLFSCEPVMCRDECVATMWTLYALENCGAGGRSGVTGQCFFAKEMALDSWRRRCAGLRTTARSTGESNCEVADGTAMTRRYVPRIQRQIYARSVIACELAAVGAVGRGRRMLDRQAYFASTGIICTPLPALSTGKTSLANYGAAMIELLHENCSSAMAVVRQHAARAVGMSGSFPTSRPTASLYIIVKLLYILALWGDPFVASAAQSVRSKHDMIQNDTNGASTQLNSATLTSVQTDLVPNCHVTIASYLRRLGLQAVGRGSQCGLFELLTRYRGVLAEVPADAAWARLLEAALWSGVSANAAGRRVETSYLHDFFVPRLQDDRGNASTECCEYFGSGSFAWLLVELNSELCLGCGDARDGSTDVSPEQSHRTRMPQSARALSSARVYQTLQLLLDHLLTLSVAVPEAARRAVLLGPFALCDARGCHDVNCQEFITGHGVRSNGNMAPLLPITPAIHSNDNNVSSTRKSTREKIKDSNDTYNVNDDEEQTWSAKTGEGMLNLVKEDEVDDCCVALSEFVEKQDRHKLDQPTVADANRVSILDGSILNKVNVEDDQADCLLHAQLGWNLPQAQHLFVSWLEVIYWATNTERQQCKPDDTTGMQKTYSSWPNTCSVAYTHLLNMWSAGALSSRRSNECLYLATQPEFIEKIILLTVHTCPDVLLLGAALMRWIEQLQRKRNACTDEVSTSQNKTSTQLCLTQKVELALTQLHYHNGLHAQRVYQWREVRAKHQNMKHSEQLMEERTMHDFHCRIYDETVKQIRNVAMPHHDEQRQELLYLVGSITLMSIEQRLKAKTTVVQNNVVHHSEKKNVNKEEDLLSKLQQIYSDPYHIYAFIRCSSLEALINMSNGQREKLSKSLDTHTTIAKKTNDLQSNRNTKDNRDKLKTLVETLKQQTHLQRRFEAPYELSAFRNKELEDTHSFREEQMWTYIYLQ